MKNNLIKLFIIVEKKQISLVASNIDEQNNLEIQEKVIIPIIENNKSFVLNLDKNYEQINKNILLIEEKLKFTFKDLILILDSNDFSFLNFTGFKKLNGTQISKENITYILNSLKFNVEEVEKNKKIIHMFNSNYTLDKKKIDNLPIGLFGDFYSHELTFCLINKNDYKNVENIFKRCNLKINKILLNSFIKSSLILNENPSINTFIHIEIDEDNSKVLSIENDTIKSEQKFNFGSNMILKDISKITALDLDISKKFIDNNKFSKNLEDSALIDENYFNNSKYRKIKKKLIFDVAEARIKELGELFYYKNVNFEKSINKVKVIFLEIADKNHLKCFEEIYIDCYAFNGNFKVKIFAKPDDSDVLDVANNIVQFGWKNEAIPVTKSQKSIFSRILKEIFQ